MHLAAAAWRGSLLPDQPTESLERVHATRTAGKRRTSTSGVPRSHRRVLIVRLALGAPTVWGMLVKSVSLNVSRSLR
jgi:hypothetical protein